ncbi:MAG TPA: BatD family protein, partial [Opitutales bacterium]|nr:BatD family protein [Opitutales bacterium]
KAADMVKTGDLISLTAVPPRTDIYVGEKLPMNITLTYRMDLQPQSLGDFTQTNDDFERLDLTGQPQQSSVAINGQRFGTATWQSALSPIKTGTQPLQFSMSLVITMPGQNQSNDPMTALLMGNAPNMFAQQQSVTLQSTPLNLNVLPLPDAGRPENFTGGIGNFTISPPTLDTTDLQVGVPVTLKFTVHGQGNFDRMQAPKLDLGTNWRSYTPKDTFKASDTMNYRGDKTFEYVLMPMAESVTELPAPQFNYFDPETKMYVEPSLHAIPVKVRPAPPGQAVALPVVASAPGEPRNTELVGLHIDAGDWQDLHPSLLLTSPYFWTAQAVPAMIFAGFVIIRRRKLRLENDPAYARRLRARQQALAALERVRSTAAKGDAAGFYTVAQRALQEAATHDRLDAAEALTWQEFDAHLAKNGASSNVRQQAHEIFAAGDALRFGGFAPDQADLTAAAIRVDKLVKQLLESA